MDFEKYFAEEMAAFLKDKIGGICIISKLTNEVMYADSFVGELYGSGEDKDVFTSDVSWLNEGPELKEGEVQVWEYLDAGKKMYFKITSSLFTKKSDNDEEIPYAIHQIVDITEYMGLNRDVTKYMAFFKKLSAFQNTVFEKLSDSSYELLPLLADYFKTDKTYMFLQRGKKIEVITYGSISKRYSQDIVPFEGNDFIFDIDKDDDMFKENLPEDIKTALKNGGTNLEGSMRLLSSGDASGQKFAVYLNVWPGIDLESMNEGTIRGVVRLYLENGIMHSRYVYQSEHDKLSGLYNKAKYMELTGGAYRELDSIGILNLDVNFLKQLNDTMGHEAGDALIKKAAKSIKAVQSKTVNGFRVGGDEFAIFVLNPGSEEAVAEVKAKWEAALAELNKEDDGINCVIACGMVYGEKEYNLDELLKKSDELMYIDKKAKKGGR